MTCAVLTSRLPYTDALGNTVDIRDGQVVVRLAAAEMPPVAALGVGAAIGHAVSLIGQRAATACPCTTSNHTDPTEGA